jgi:hypothetical protein
MFIHIFSVTRNLNQKNIDPSQVDNLNKGFIKSISFSRYTCIHEYTIAIYCSLDRHCKTQSINIKPTSDDWYDDRNRNRNKFINQIRAPGGHIQITIMIDTQQQYK